MPLARFLSTLRDIRRKPHVDTLRGTLRHFQWQVRRALGLFPVELTLSRSMLIAVDGNCGVSALVNCQGMYDWNNMHLLQRLLEHGGTFFDIGANVGSYTLIAAEQPAARVVAFEPHPRTFNVLWVNANANDYDNITLEQLAVGATDGHVSFSDRPHSALNSIQAGEGTIQVRCTRIDTWCARNQMRPDFVKIDVEGFEHDALVGFGDLLPSVKVLFIEQNRLAGLRATGAAPILALLHDAGFDGPLRWDHDSGQLLPPGGTEHEDSVFVNRTFRDRVTGP